MTWATESGCGTQSRKLSSYESVKGLQYKPGKCVSGMVLCTVGFARSWLLSCSLFLVLWSSVLLLSGPGNTWWPLACGMTDSGGTLLYEV